MEERARKEDEGDPGAEHPVGWEDQKEKHTRRLISGFGTTLQRVLRTTRERR